MNLIHKIISVLKIRIMSSPALEEFLKLYEVWQCVAKFVVIFCPFKIKDIQDKIDNEMLHYE